MEDQILDDIIHSEEEHRLVRAANEKRFINYLADSFISSVLIIMLFALFGLGGLIDPETMAENTFFFQLLVYLFFVAYYAIFEFLSNGKTPGKMLTGTRVVDLNGHHPEFQTIVGRSFARIIPFEAFSFFFRPSNGWHDSLSQTMVIDEKLSLLPMDEDFV